MSLSFVRIASAWSCCANATKGPSNLVRHVVRRVKDDHTGGDRFLKCDPGIRISPVGHPSDGKKRDVCIDHEAHLWKQMVRNRMRLGRCDRVDKAGEVI